MKIEAKITKTLSTDTVKAIADITLDDSVVIHGVKLIDSKGGQFVSMPSDRWQDKDGNVKHTDIVHPTNAEVRREFDEAVKGAYQSYLQSQSSVTQNAGISM